MKSNTYWADKIADFLDEGYSSEEAVSRISVLISKNKLDLKIGKIINEFKRVYGKTPFNYELSIITGDQNLPDLEEEFMNFKS